MTNGTATVEATDGGDLGGLSVEENAFFESGGNSPIPGGDSGAGDSGAAAPAPEAGGDAGKKAAGGADHVPLATFLEEKNSRKALDKQLREAQQQIAEFRGKFSIIERLQGAGAENEAPKVPTPEEDIFGAVKHVTDTLAQIQAREAEAKTARETADKEAAASKTFVDNYRADAAKFAAATPDYMEGYKFLLNSRAAELKAIGFEGEALHNAIMADEQAIAARAFEQGKSPAEFLYSLATLRGYVKKAATDPESGKGAEKLDAIERGQNANKTLNGTGGASGDAGMTAERLLAMSSAEFETWCDKHPAQAKRIMGG